MSSEPGYAYTSAGKLFIKQPGSAAREIESTFAREAIRRAQDAREKSAWKFQDNGQGMLSRSQLWNSRAGDPAAMRIAIHGLTRGVTDGQLMFLLDSDISCGVFTLDLEGEKERRVMHRAHFAARDLQQHPDDHTLLYSQRSEDGTARIVTADAEHTRPVDITTGDSVDEAPSWVPGSTRRIVYQSAGLGRNQAGFAVALGPSAIQRLDIETGEMETLAEDPRVDFLAPRYATDGSLWYIRRPYRGQKQYGPVTLVKDIVLFPFRFARAVFGFMNVFSMIFSQKPLTAAGGAPQMPGTDPALLMLRGRFIDARKVMNQVAKGKDAPGIVPKDWELIRRGADGVDVVIARGVVAFDLAGDTVHYSNGTGIFAKSPGADARLVEKGRLIDSVLVLPKESVVGSAAA